VEFAKENAPFAFGHGILKIGESLAPLVIKHLKKYMDKSSINIIDAAPGTTCPVVKSMEGMDYCLLVTEPTPFGLNDLTLAALLAAKLNLPTGIVINRSYGADQIIEDFATSCQIPIVGKIPFDKKYAQSYSKGDVLIKSFPELKAIFADIYLQMKLIQRVPLVDEIKDQDVGAMVNIFSDNNKIQKTPYQEMVVISGKGGTGKTTITSALAELMENKVLADNDVDASNLYLLCKPEVLKSGDFTGGKKYFIDQDKCVGCGACLHLCHFDAVHLASGKPGKYEINKLSCEGCGLCYHLCKFGAISSYETVSGKWYISKTKQGYLSHAKLGTGEENSGKLVSLVRNNASDIAQHFGMKHILSDGPPGTGCPVISAITGVDQALVVTEPTLSGIHDMQRALDLAKHFSVPSFIVINKFDLNREMTERIRSIAKEYKSKVIGEIPFDKNVHDALMKGESVVTYKKGEAYLAILNLWKNLDSQINQDEMMSVFKNILERGVK